MAYHISIEISRFIFVTLRTVLGLLDRVFLEDICEPGSV